MCYNNLVDKIDFSTMVKQARNEAKLSQEALASVLNVSFATINRWENKKTMPTKLARVAFDNFCKEKGIEFEKDGK
ncbi:transcriptional regulator [Spirochaetia bacterium]|nr:transcriptional regulator [Spirochaetia bacterium]